MAIEGKGNLNRTQIPLPGKLGYQWHLFGGRVGGFWQVGPKEPLNISSGGLICRLSDNGHLQP